MIKNNKIELLESQYKILKVTDLLEYLKEKESRGLFEMDECISKNSNYVYYLKSGEVILLPGNINDNSHGILFTKKEYLDICKKYESFPIENENKKLEEYFQNEIIEINVNIKHIFLELCVKLNTVEYSDLGTSSIQMVTEIAKKKWKKLSLTDQVYSVLLIGEYLRIVFGGKWLLLKKYGTFNAYYQPAILYPDNKVQKFWNSFSLFFDHKITLSAFAQLDIIKNPSLILNEHLFSTDYLILD